MLIDYSVEYPINLTALLSECSDVDLSPLAGVEVLICFEGSPHYVVTLERHPDREFGVSVFREDDDRYRSMSFAFRNALRSSEGYSVHCAISEREVLVEIFGEDAVPAEESPADSTPSVSLVAHYERGGEFSAEIVDSEEFRSLNHVEKLGVLAMMESLIVSARQKIISSGRDKV